MKNSSDGSFFTFTDYTNITYVAIKQSITINAKNNETFYMLICANLAETQEEIDLLSTNFDDTYTIILWTVITIGIIIFGIILLLLYFITRKLSDDLGKIGFTLWNISRKGLFPKTVSLGYIEEAFLKVSSGTEGLVEGVKFKINYLESLECRYSGYIWNNTRPSDKLLYTQWVEKAYPENSYYNIGMPWRETLKVLRQETSFFHIDDKL